MFFDKCAVYCPVHLPFLPQTHTPRHRITFSPRLSFSIRDPDINGTYPGKACGMVLLFQSIIIYRGQLNEHMYENNNKIFQMRKSFIIRVFKIEGGTKSKNNLSIPCSCGIMRKETEYGTTKEN